MYEKFSDYGGQRIRESKKGWIVEGWSRYQGNRTNYKFLIPYENCRIKKGEDLNDDYNEYMSKGEYLIQNYHINMDSKFIKVLNRGYSVQ
jgi:hypothetical protein